MTNTGTIAARPARFYLGLLFVLSVLITLPIVRAQYP